jgi:hypothetical protein
MKNSGELFSAIFLTVTGLSHSILEGLTGSELRRSHGGNFDSFFGFGVHPLSFFPLGNRELAKARQVHFPAPGKGLGDFIQNHIQTLSCLSFGQAGFPYDSLN